MRRCVTEELTKLFFNRGCGIHSHMGYTPPPVVFVVYDRKVLQGKILAMSRLLYESCLFLACGLADVNSYNGICAITV